MQIRHLLFAIPAMILLTASGASRSLVVAQDSECHRKCLITFMQQYLAALVKDDPKAAPFAEEVKFVQNTANIPFCKGLQVTASGGPIDFRIYAAGRVEQKVACPVTMKEDNNQSSFWELVADSRTARSQKPSTRRFAGLISMATHSPIQGNRGTGMLSFDGNPSGSLIPG